MSSSPESKSTPLAATAAKPASVPATQSKKPESSKSAVDQESLSEIRELDAIDPSGSEAFFQPEFQDKTYDAFHKILAFARDLNVQVTQPEIVFVGPARDGKSSLIDALIGLPLLAGNKGSSSTQRPVFISIVNNPELKSEQSEKDSHNAYRITLRRDLSAASVAGAEKDQQFEENEVAKARQELHKRVSTEGARGVPVYVTIEMRSALNMTLIDAPALDLQNLESDEQQRAVLDVLRPSHRQIVAVEQAADWSGVRMLNAIKRIDPSLTRTVFVFTKFHSLLRTLDASHKLNRYLASKPRDAQSFFVSLLSQGTLESCSSDKEAFRAKIFQSYQRDRQLMDGLQFDKRFAQVIGTHMLNRYLQQHCWKTYQDAVPEVLKRLRSVKRESSERLERLKDMLNSLTSAHLRTIATNYVVQFLQAVEKLIAGTAEGNPSVNGQTLHEEKIYGVGEWMDANYQEISVDAEAWKIPFHSSRLYGGQQFERLISEFKAVVDNMSIPEITMDDVATAAGLNRLNNLPNYAYASCDIASQKVRECLVPIIDQLAARASYIMKRLTSVVLKVMESRKKNKTASAASTVTDLLDREAEDVDRFPYFAYHVKDLYCEFVDQTAALVREKCMDEFYSTQCIYWDMNESEQLTKGIPTDNSDPKAVRSAVVKLSTHIFDDIKQRIAKNTVLKFYNFFLIPIQTSLWSEIQGTVTTLSDEALSEIFEVDAVRDKLAEDEKALQELLKKTIEQEQEFLKSSTVFSHNVNLKHSDEPGTHSSSSSTGGVSSPGGTPRLGSARFGQRNSGPPSSLLGRM